MANEYFWECLAVCLSENRKVLSQIYPKIEDLFWLKQIIWVNASLA